MNTYTYKITENPTFMSDYRRIRNLSARMECGYNPSIINLHVNQQVKNADETQDDLPVYGDTWINYWKVFTMEDIPTVCPLCGKVLTEDEVDGCHIQIKSQSIMSNGNYEKTEYIIPGHHKCNCQFGKEFNLKLGVKAIEAIKK